MNRMSYRRIALSALLATLMAAPAIAQKEPEKMPPAAAAGKEGMEKGMMEGMGKEGMGGMGMDGPMKYKRMSREERFKKDDTNADGFLSREEVLAAHKARIDEMFQRMDENKDDKLSPEEMKKGHMAMREKMHENMKDHHEEMEEKMEKMMEERGEHGAEGAAPASGHGH